MQLIKTLSWIINHPLNKDKKLKALMKYVKWQISSRLISGNSLHYWIGDTRFYVRPGETGLTGNIYTGLHEFAEMSLLLHFLLPEDLFVDVGSNCGSYTILACGIKKSKGLAFEPIPETYKKLVANISLNNIEHLAKTYNIGLAEKQGDLLFTSGLDVMNHIIPSGKFEDDLISVKVTTLDLILKDQSPAFIKIDVEGFELSVLQGAEFILNKKSLKIVVVELNGSGSRYGYDENKILCLLERCGFKSYSYNPFDRTLINLNSKNFESGNTIFVRDIAFVLERVRKSEYITINEKSF